MKKNFKQNLLISICQLAGERSRTVLIASCLLPLAYFSLSCNKPFNIIEPAKPARFAIPVYYSTVYSFDQRKYKLKYNTGWYDMYQSIYNNEAPGYLGKLYAGEGSIKYNADEFTLLQAGFNPKDEQGYYELPDHITRFFEREFKTSDSTLSNVRYSYSSPYGGGREGADSLIFTTKNPEKYTALLEVQVMQTVDLY